MLQWSVVLACNFFLGDTETISAKITEFGRITSRRRVLLGSRVTVMDTGE